MTGRSDRMLGRLNPFGGARRSAEGRDAFDATFLSRLDRVRLRPGRATGLKPGETAVRGPAQATGIELESYQSYAPGDDIRYVDWIAFGRLDQLYTRRFVPERQIQLHVLVDGSASMASPEADEKFSFATGLAAALAYVALNHSEPVRIATVRRTNGEVLLQETPLLRHRGRFFDLRPFLSNASASGETALADGAGRYLERHHERGLAFVISDFLVEPDAYDRCFERLQSGRLEVRAIHVVGPEERSLTRLRGRLRIRDVETGTFRDVSLSEGDRRRYRDAFEVRVAAVRECCRRRGVGYALAETGLGVESCMTGVMARQGMLAFR